MTKTVIILKDGKPFAQREITGSEYSESEVEAALGCLLELESHLEEIDDEEALEELSEIREQLKSGELSPMDTDWLTIGEFTGSCE